MQKEPQVSISEYINDFSSKVELLEQAGIQIQDELLTVMLLSSLPAEFEIFVVAIETRDENRGSEKKVPKPKGNCFKCGTAGHIASECRSSPRSRHSRSETEALLSVAYNCKTDREQWCLDSGATKHICNNKNMFKHLDTRKSDIYTISNECVRARGTGEVTLKLKGQNVTLKDTLYIPKSRRPKLDEKTDPHLRPQKEKVASIETMFCRENNIKRWHQRYGKSYSQRPGIHFIPVARISSIRLILALATRLDMYVHQLDISNAYLNGYLEEEIYMEIPINYEKILRRIVRDKNFGSEVRANASLQLQKIKKANKVCKLERSLYGLKQAGHVWNLELDKQLKHE
ncbi:UNVERIFIED_CONTAM: hypothetical protein PYX00_002023 [Menopon gallinae]|uniref:CCHC-type domain-containing protein n=1 Tax=Menopon gallinae TaxID=328185 RepID=A0AAW2IER9_9NEOP